MNDEMKKKVLESLLAELEEREVDSMGSEDEASEDACPYCGKSGSEDNEDCSMHDMHMKEEEAPAKKPKSLLKIKLK